MGIQSITKIRPPAEPLTDLLVAAAQLENEDPDVRICVARSLLAMYVRRTAAAATAKCAELEETAELAVHKDIFRYVRRTAAAATAKCAELEETAELAVHKVAAAQLENEDPDVRICVARSLLAMHRASVSEAPPKSRALNIVRRVFKSNEELEGVELVEWEQMWKQREMHCEELEERGH
ncbi:hypothetical protein AK812_SmicGene42148 [Symbiodinium microadriaticum]|uniref:Uncharacterized protein n=1 Tax=Symbiodinium microadriaticum TaxID=2951 RepID=A0A1Q9C4C7_SYMMI|nr:hypothetical protein AK812_SmicGene42148 [Symbiodinium microadriaticum]